MGLWGPAASPEAAETELRRRLHSLGMPAFRGFATHTNRTVLLSVTGRGVLRLHRGFAWAPDRVLAAIVRYVRPGTHRATRRAAELEFLAFPVEAHAAPSRPSRRGAERPRPGDDALLARLIEIHARLNAAHFGGALPVIRFRLSGRMRSRLGELSVDARIDDVVDVVHFATDEVVDGDEHIGRGAHVTAFEERVGLRREIRDVDAAADALDRMREVEQIRSVL